MKISIPEVRFNHTNCDSGFEIINFDELYQRKKVISQDIHHSHRLKFYQMIYITDGIGIHTIDFNKISLEKGSFIFISPTQVQSFDNKVTLKGYLCLFTEEFLAREFNQLADRYMVEHLYLRDITKPLVLHSNSMEDFFYLLEKEFITMKITNKSSVVTSLMHCIFVKSKEQLGEKFIANENSILFNAFNKILLDNYSYMRNAEDYALLLKVSTKHLNLTCKRLTGLTSKSFIDRFLIVESKRYLSATTLPIKDIATKMGHGEVGNFSKFFKKHTELSPKNFRDLHD